MYVHVHAHYVYISFRYQILCVCMMYDVLCILQFSKYLHFIL